jgi:xylulokinase
VLFTIDIGTSTLKSALWDFDGNRISSAAVSLSANENICSQWLRAFEQCCKKYNDLSAIKAIVISGNGPTLVPVTGAPETERLFVPAEDVIMYHDRGADEYQSLVSELMDGYVDSRFFLPKILSIKNNKKFYDKIKFFLGCPEYLAYALTNEARTVFPSDGFERWFWNDTVLEKLGLEKEKFPCFIRPGDTIGNLPAFTASRYGFTANIPVIAGGPDFFAAILGCGVTEPGQACDRCGSSEGINLCTKIYVDDDRLMCYGHPVKPWWNVSRIIAATGKAIERCRDILGLASYDDFFALAADSQVLSGGYVFSPYLSKPDIENVLRGLCHSARPEDIANSVLEGIGFAIRDIIAIMENGETGVNELRVTGGQAGRSRLNQIKADITGKVVLEPACKDAELLGLAIIGSCALGKFSSFKEASQALVCIEKQYEPNLKNTALYNGIM